MEQNPEEKIEHEESKGNSEKHQISSDSSPPHAANQLVPPVSVPFSHFYKPWQAEAAKSNRAQCHETSCKCNIGKGVLRLGHYQGDNMFISWYHAPCAFRSVLNNRLRNPPITSPEVINGYDTLSAEHKSLIDSLIDGTYVEPPAVDYSNRPKRSCVVAKEAQKQLVEEPENQSKKRQRKK